MRKLDDKLDAEQLRTECYRRHGYDRRVLHVPIEAFLHDEDYCIVKTDSPVDDFEIDFGTKCVTINSLVSSYIQRIYLAMAYWYALTEAERTPENEKQAFLFAIEFLLPSYAFEIFVSEMPDVGFVDACQILDVPAYMIEMRYAETEEYDQILDRYPFFVPE